MTQKEKIETALKAKGWTVKDIFFDPVSYAGDGREGGWYVEIDTDNCSLEVAKQMDKLDALCHIEGYNAKDVLSTIEKMPKFETA